MAKLTIGDKTVTVDDSFLKLSPEEQNATVEEIASQLGLSAPAPKEQRPAIGGNMAAMQGIQQGLTFGFGDELMAGLMTPVEAIKGAITGEDSGKGFLDRISDSYDRNLARERQRTADAREQHPVITTAGEVAGGLVTGGQLAKSGVTLMQPGQSLPKMVGAGALEGGAYGGLYGFGEGEGGAANRLENAAYGAGVGAAIGGAIPLAARAIGSGVRAVLDSRAATPAQRMILDDIAAEGLTPEQLGQRVRDLGPEGMIADASDTLRLRAEQIAQSDNPGRTTVIDALRERSARAGDRITSAYDAAAGARPDVKQMLDDLITTRSTQSSPLYERAMSRPVVWDNRLQQFLDDPVAKKGLSRGMEIQRLEALAEGKPFNPSDYAIIDFDAAGDPIVGKVPNMRTLNVVKKGLDALVEESKNEFGKLSERGRAIDAVRRAFVKKLDAMNPDYAAARKAWEGPTKTLQAFQRGQDLLSSKVHPDFLKKELQSMSEAERDAIKLGVRAAIDEAMGRVRNGALKGRTLLDADWNARKIRAVLGDKEGAKLINALLAEQRMAETTNQALGNSATARRQDNPFRKRQPATETAGIARSALNLRMGDAAARARDYGINAWAGRRASNLGAEAAPLLVSRGGEADRVVQSLMEANMRRQGLLSAQPLIEDRARNLLMGGARVAQPASQ